MTAYFEELILTNNSNQGDLNMSIQTNWQEEMDDWDEEAHHYQQEAQYENIVERIAKRHEAMMKRYPHLKHALEESQSQRSSELWELMQTQRLENIQKNKFNWRVVLRELYEEQKHFCWRADRDVGISGVLTEEYMTYKQQCHITGLIMQDDKDSDPINEYISQETENFLKMNMGIGEGASAIASLLKQDAVDYYRDKIQRQLDEWFDDEFGAHYSGDK